MHPGYTEEGPTADAALDQRATTETLVSEFSINNQQFCCTGKDEPCPVRPPLLQLLIRHLWGLVLHLKYETALL